MLIKEHDLYIPLCIQASKPVELLSRAKYHLLKKNNGFFLRRFFRKLIPNFDTKAVPNGLRTQREKRSKTSKISEKFAPNKAKSNCGKELVSEWE